MILGKTYYAKNRAQWRRWLEKNHAKAKDIWLVYYSKASGKPRVPYVEAVQEALCFGWIDSIVKKVDEHGFAQRFTPRRKGSVLSQLNREHVRMLIKSKLMTQAGMDAIAHRWKDKFVFPEDIKKALQRDPLVWKNFQKFPAHYRRIRVAAIEWNRPQPAEFKKRLEHFLKLTKANKRFGMVQ